MTGRLVHTGQVIIDLVMRVPAVPAPGGDMLASETGLFPGGGFNVMAAAARSGARVVYAGAHGTGRFGDQARAALAAEGIETAQQPNAAQDTGVCVALVDATGERTFVTGTGAEGRLLPDQLSSVDTEAEDLVYVTGYSFMHESNRAALRDWLPGLEGPRVLFDPGPLATEAVLTEILSTVDILSANAAEARSLSGETDIPTAAKTLLSRLKPGSAVVIRNGAEGCVLAHDGNIAVVPGFPVTPVDTNGAGDTHCGVLAAALLAGADLATAAVRANAAAALSVLETGPATAPSAEQIDRFLASAST
ncbi:PfkB family carbohydrate kinase [Kibdelosporangium philippinense]|uniref:PfkB family carbohydrate kinase n=1 Tax=Kibdelosporangium philippinense TaxID=211113 RepID=A0ABS8Z9N6_9PSEU|nr:PfkB family carbohydrate kinase [Kibdelosporangium philippinense]MCE7003748.1 PfkB family carbohydrate kinase [Kibdelosporangium philippinense]